MENLRYLALRRAWLASPTHAIRIAEAAGGSNETAKAAALLLALEALQGRAGVAAAITSWWRRYDPRWYWRQCLALAGGCFSPCRCFRRRRRTDRGRPIQAPTHLRQQASRAFPRLLRCEDQRASRRSRHLPRWRARVRRRPR